MRKGERLVPLVRPVPRVESTPLAIEVRVEKATADGKGQWRLVFPYGYVVLDGPGTYTMRVRFACPGPRPDQRELLDAGYWRGGQLVSNAIELVVK